MSIPALRQPKTLEKPKTVQNYIECAFYVLTLRNEKKLIIPSDSYHGIITTSDMYKCVFCRTDMHLDYSFKEDHKISEWHKKTMEGYPHMDEYAGNLIRKLNNHDYYCTICNVIISNVFVKRHLDTEVHIQELNRATSRALVYAPI